MVWLAGTALIAIAVLITRWTLRRKRRSRRRSHTVIERRSWGGIDEFRRAMEAIAPDTDSPRTDDD